VGQAGPVGAVHHPVAALAEPWQREVALAAIGALRGVSTGCNGSVSRH
jgi:hypothetical protein